MGRYGKLTVLNEAGSKGGRKTWLLLCDCGTKFVGIARDVRRGHTASCGCLRSLPHARKHGHAKDSKGKQSREYTAWLNMKKRCDNPSSEVFGYYGGRGIAYCERWKSFENFIADMGKCPDGLTLDRIDVNGGYSKENCRWTTMKEQAKNRRNTRWITYGGETLSLPQWAERLGLEQETLRSRLDRGMPLDRALQP